MSGVEFRVWSLACFLGLLACTGCGSGPALIPVEGKVTVGGQPLAAAKVVFYPTEELPAGTRLDIVGVIGADGAYRMTTNGKAGVPKGKYKATVNTLGGAGAPPPVGALPAPTAAPPPPPRRKANIKYESPDTTDLTVEVPSSSYDLGLTP